MIIYFTGMGNSRLAAEAIADRLADKALSANDFIKRRKRGNFKSRRPWVFVFPVYLSTMAEIFAGFLRASVFEGSKKAYFVATCAGVMGSSPNRARDICVAKDLEYMGVSQIKMPQNYIAHFKMTEAEECEKRISAVPEQADKICAAILEGRTLDMKLAPRAEYAVTKLVERLYNDYFTRDEKFFTTDKCVGCGVCANVCPVNNISITDGVPEWNKKCVHCMSCINRCPARAIEYGKKTSGKSRYVCRRYRPEAENGGQ